MHTIPSVYFLVLHHHLKQTLLIPKFQGVSCVTTQHTFERPFQAFRATLSPQTRLTRYFQRFLPNLRSRSTDSPHTNRPHAPILMSRGALCLHPNGFAFGGLSIEDIILCSKYQGPCCYGHDNTTAARFVEIIPRGPEDTAHGGRGVTLGQKGWTLGPDRIEIRGETVAEGTVLLWCV